MPEKKVEIRKNLNETAFFYPQLKTDSAGSVIISFTAPESLTKWKIMGLAHTKDLRVGYLLNEAITQKSLMVTHNLPRFLREGDTVVISAKISNLSNDSIYGNARIELLDASTGKSVSKYFNLASENTKYSVSKISSTSVSWKIIVPQDLSVVICRISAESKNFTDGEEQMLPIISNRMLVTETLPLPIKGNETREFKLDKLLNNTSKTLKNHKLTLEFTSNPTWYAIQALPYLMEFPYECAEQTFNRLYANTIAASIVNSNPQIKKVFEVWKNYSSDALLSNLEKNQELKSVVLQETPWLLDAKNESQQKQRIALLFDINKMSNEKNAIFDKLKLKQNSNGSFSWFNGMYEDRYITQYIVSGFGHLENIGVLDDNEFESIIKKAISYIDNKIAEDYCGLKKSTKAEELKKYQLSSFEIQYLYARSFYLTKYSFSSNAIKEAYNFYLTQAYKYWTSQSKYMQGMIALIAKRNGNNLSANDIIKSLKETALHNEELGMYWKENVRGYFWSDSPIEVQSLLVEAFKYVSNDTANVEDMQLWLLKQKQTNNWATTKATADACYALLLGNGKNALTDDAKVVIHVGKELVSQKENAENKAEAGTGYFKTSWNREKITPEMGTVTVSKNSKGAAWGAIYWQYFEQLEKITPASSPLKIKKQLFLNKKTNKGIELESIKDGAIIHVGDKVTVRMVISSDRDMEYIHIKDMRASGFEPTTVISGYKYENGLGYYESTGDVATNFFISYLNKGTYVFEYTLYANNEGEFSNGITQIECMYAPEFNAHSEGLRIKIDK